MGGFVIITNKFTNYNSKSEKISKFRKKHNAIRHEYYSMAEKYSHYHKKMLTFTVPSAIKGKTIKKGRYTKLKYLLELRSYLSKCFNNSDGIKYFMNIELGKAYSNPHLHVQLWINPSTSSSHINLIHKKAIDKFDLDSNRCTITEPLDSTQDDYIYSYVIKDYAKGLSDKELYDLEIQKKRMREQLCSKVRFYSKSSDKYTQKIYRVIYKYYGVVRKYANEFIDKLISMFFRKEIPQQKCLVYLVSKLWIYITRKYVLYFCMFIFIVLCSCRDPPCVYLSILFYKSILNVVESYFLYFERICYVLLCFSVWCEVQKSLL